MRGNGNFFHNQVCHVRGMLRDTKPAIFVEKGLVLKILSMYLTRFGSFLKSTLRSLTIFVNICGFMTPVYSV